MHFKFLYIHIKHLIFFNLKGPLFLFLSLMPIFFICQNIDQNQNDIVSKVFEKEDMNEEIIKLEIKRENLLNRKQQLIIDTEKNTVQINRIKEIVRYIDNKIDKLNFQLKLEEDCHQKGMPVKGLLSEEEYIKKKQEWDKLNPELKNELEQKQLILRKHEFGKLPKERQDKILSMPERYLIIED